LKAKKETYRLYHLSEMDPGTDPDLSRWMPRGTTGRRPLTVERARREENLQLFEQYVTMQKNYDQQLDKMYQHWKAGGSVAGVENYQQSGADKMEEDHSRHYIQKAAMAGYGKPAPLRRQDRMQPRTDEPSEEQSSASGSEASGSDSQAEEESDEDHEEEEEHR
jgi:hypothetical protein